MLRTTFRNATFSVFFCILSVTAIHAQVGIGTTDPNPETLLEIESDNKGILIPRINLTSLSTLSPITSPTSTAEEGLMVYNTNTALGRGFYFWNGVDSWVPVGSAAANSDWFEEGTTSAPEFITDSIYTLGNVGIGLNNPNSTLHLYEATGTPASGNDGTLFLEHGNSGGESSIVFKSTVNPDNDFGYISYSDNGSPNGSSTENSLLEIGVENDDANVNQDDVRINASGSFLVNTDAVERMRVTPNGQVLIGAITATDPLNKLEVISNNPTGSAIFAVGSQYGVWGRGTVAGLMGTSANSTGTGVFAQSNGTGNALYATNNGTGNAIHAAGRVVVGVPASVAASASLVLSESNKGFLPNQVSLPATNVAGPVLNPATGLLVYNTNTTTGATGVSPGYYYWNGTAWVRFIAGADEKLGTHDQTLTANRTINFSGNNLIFNGAPYGSPTDIMGVNSAGAVVRIPTSSAYTQANSDWYEQGTSAPPNAISDNIYTQGSVAIGPVTTVTANPSASLELTATNKGILINKVVLTSTSGAGPVVSPAEGLLVYNTNTAGTGSTAVTPGFYFWTGTNWSEVGGVDEQLGNTNQTLSANRTINFAGTRSLSFINNSRTYLADGTLFLRTEPDALNALRFAGTTAFGGVTKVGPALYGQAGGLLGSKTATSGGETVALEWTANGKLKFNQYTNASTTFNAAPLSYLGVDTNGNVVKTAAANVNNDWYKEGTTTPPDAITDNIYTRGEVGIGLTTPEATLHISEATGTAPAIVNNEAVGSMILEHKNNGGTSSIVFRSAVNGDSDFGYISYSDDGSSGSTTENSLLEIGVENDGNTTYSDDLRLKASASLLFNTGGNERMRITPGGQTLIGTATPFHTDGAALTDKLAVQATGAHTAIHAKTATGTGISGESTSTSGTGTGIRGNSLSWQGTGVYGERTNNGGDNTGWAGSFINDIWVTGYGASSVGWYDVSDERLKTNIQALQSGLDVVQKLNPVSYQYNQEKFPHFGLQKGVEYGFISQEVREILPSIVKEKAIDVNSVNPEEEAAGMKKNYMDLLLMDYTRIIPITVKAIQEQQEIIESQNEKIESMEARIQKLETMVQQLVEQK